MDGPKGKPGAIKPDKAERLARALRENLRRRKAQLRARARGGGAESAGNRLENDTDSSEKR
jgi:hypothetical protein